MKRILKDRYAEQTQDFLIPVQAVNPTLLKELRDFVSNSEFARELAHNQALGFDMKVGTNDLERLQSESLPRKTRDRIARAQMWYESDDLLNGLINVKVDFTTMGLSFRVASEEEVTFDSPEPEEEKVSTGNSPKLSSEEIQKLNERSSFQRKLNRIFRKWDWDAVVNDLVRDWVTTDSCILYWKVEQSDSEVINETGAPASENSKEALLPGVTGILALNPSHVDWDNSYGNDRLLYKIPAAIVARINAAHRLADNLKAVALKALADAGIPESWIEAVKKGKDMVELRREDGDRWLIRTRGRKHSGLCSPSMYTIFLALEVRKALEEGDMSAAYLMKHFILHVTAGESITQGPLAGTRNNWAKPKEINKIFDTVKTTNKAQRMVTNHTVKFNFVFPPKEMWGLDKFSNCENRIYNWAGVNIIIMTGDGGTNASGFLGARRMIASMGKARTQVKYLITEFFDDDEIREIAEVPEDTLVTAVFDENALKDPRQLLEELKFMMQEGFGDPQQATRELGRDPESVAMSKAESIQRDKKTKVYHPIYQKQQRTDRQIKQSNRGKPPNPGTEPNEQTRNPEDTIQ